MYAAASGMAAELGKYQLYANNLANANTIGYRRTRPAQRAFLSDLQAAQGVASTTSGGTDLTEGRLDLRPGPLRQTGNPLDLALSGPGLFVVSTPAGERYTRAGNFSLDASGRLVNASGHAVQGTTGPLTLAGGQITVNERGEVFADGKSAGQLRLVEPTPGATVRAAGDGLLEVASVTPAAATTVRQGSLEYANLQPTEELVALMRGLRGYEASASALRVQDESLGELIRGAGGE